MAILGGEGRDRDGGGGGRSKSLLLSTPAGLGISLLPPSKAQCPPSCPPARLGVPPSPLLPPSWTQRPSVPPHSPGAAASGSAL